MLLQFQDRFLVLPAHYKDIDMKKVAKIKDDRHH